jgi:UDP-N-acetyl-2-amino-2-deoxyglucuronate dehydrogenase
VEKKIDFIAICTPNYLHDAHIRFALRNNADAICEKPLVLNPWNIDQLLAFEQKYDKKIYTILQLRLHPAVINLRNKVQSERRSAKYNIDLQYITARGNWYH